MATQSAASKIQANLQDLFKANLSPGDSHIRFQLTSDITALLSMERVEESLVVDMEQITVLPSMPESAIGIMSSRNRVFCVFDLAELLGLPSPIGSPRKYQVIILRSFGEQPQYFGLAISSLQGMQRISYNEIKSAAENSQLAPYLRGVILEQNLSLAILDFASILEAITNLR